MRRVEAARLGDWWSGAVALLLLAVGVLTGCTPPIEPPLRLGTNLWIGYEPLYLARDLGRLDPAEVQLIEMSSATEVSRALRHGRLEAAALTLDEVITLVESGQDLRVVLVLDLSAGGDALLAVPGIDSLPELAGKRVGAETSAVGALMLDAALDEAGLTLADVTLVPLTIDEHLRAYRQGRVDVLVTFDPVRSRLLAEGARVLFHSGQIPGRIVDVLAVREDVLRTQPQRIEQIVAAQFDALRHLDRDPQDAARRMSTRLGITPLQVHASLLGVQLPDEAFNRSLMLGEPSMLQDSARRLAELMHQRGMLGRVVATEGIADTRFLQEPRG